MRQKHSVLPQAAWSGRARSVAAAMLSAALVVGCGQTPEDMLASAKTYLEKRDLSAASIQLKNALQENGSLAEARFLLGGIHLEQGDVAGAVKELQRARELGYPSESVAPLLARALLGAGEYDTLLKDFADTRVADKAAQATILAALGDASFAKGDADTARARFVEALAVDPDQTSARIGIARAHVLKGELQPAEDEAREAIKRNPGSAEAHAVLFDVLNLRNQPDAAIAALREAVRLSPRAVSYHFALVSQLLRRSDMPEAEKALKAMQQVAASHPSTRYLQALMDYQNNRLVEARDILLKVLKDAPQFLPAELLAGTVLVRLNEHIIGRSHLERVLERAPREPMARRVMVLSTSPPARPRARSNTCSRSCRRPSSTRACSASPARHIWRMAISSAPRPISSVRRRPSPKTRRRGYVSASHAWPEGTPPRRSPIWRALRRWTTPPSRPTLRSSWHTFAVARPTRRSRRMPNSNASSPTTRWYTTCAAVSCSPSGTSRPRVRPSRRRCRSVPSTSPLR